MSFNSTPQIATLIIDNIWELENKAVFKISSGINENFLVIISKIIGKNGKENKPYKLKVIYVRILLW